MHGQVGGVTALSVRGKFMFDAATHRDFLGACLGTGIERSKVGDILINGEQGAHVLVVPELAEFLGIHLTSVCSLSISKRMHRSAAMELLQYNCCHCEST